MNLPSFFDAMAPLLAGQADPTRTAQELGIDPVRLGLYHRFCQAHREEILEGLYPTTRRLLPAPTWDRLVRAYFEAHPCTDWDLNTNGQHLPAFLAQHAQDWKLPEWVAEVADLEWWQWSVWVAADEPVAAAEWALHPTLVVRHHAHDVVACLDKPGSPPPRRSTLTAVWRDAQGTDRVHRLDAAQLVIIKAVVEAVPWRQASLQAGLDGRRLAKARRELQRLGILFRSRPG